MGAACPSRGITKQAEHSFALSVVDSASESFETQQFRLPSPVPVASGLKLGCPPQGGEKEREKERREKEESNVC